MCSLASAVVIQKNTPTKLFILIYVMVRLGPGRPAGMTHACIGVLRRASEKRFGSSGRMVRVSKANSLIFMVPVNYLYVSYKTNKTTIRLKGNLFLDKQRRVVYRVINSM